MSDEKKEHKWGDEELTIADLIRFWNSTPIEDVDKEWIPFMAKHRDVLPHDHPVQQLIDRWDPDSQSVRPCQVCGGLRWEHEGWCSESIDWNAMDE